MEAISQIMTMDGEKVPAVLLVADGTCKEVEIDTTPRLNQPGMILGGGAPTFIGQWSRLGVVLMCQRSPGADVPFNEHELRAPFGSLKGKVKGDILLMRMDDDANPQAFTLKEYEAFVAHKDADKDAPELSDDMADEMLPSQGDVSMQSMDELDDDEDEDYQQIEDDEDDEEVDEDDDENDEDYEEEIDREKTEIQAAASELSKIPSKSSRLNAKSERTG